VVKLELLSEEEPTRINEIWDEYHDNRADAIGSSWSLKDYKTFQKRSEMSAMFVFPITREDGNFVMLSQIQEKHCLLTMLDEYKLDPVNAQPWLALTFYDELAKDKEMVLVRGDVQAPQLTLEEGERLCGNVRHFYLNEYDELDKFNNRPTEFDIEKHLARDFTKLL